MAAHLKIKEISSRAGRSITIPYQYIGGGARSQRTNPYSPLTLTRAFSGAQKRAETLRNPCILGGPQTKGDEIRSGCLTHAFSGAQKRAEVLRYPCILRGPLQRGQNQNWLPHP